MPACPRFLIMRAGDTFMWAVDGPIWPCGAVRESPIFG
jgi:hypothetical protein